MLSSSRTCLVVHTTCPEALPILRWSHDPPELFGFKTEYYNPCHQLQPTWKAYKSCCVGIYSVTEPLPERPICEVSANQIDTIAVYEGTLERVIMLFESLDWEVFIQRASKVYEMHEGRLVGIAA